MKKIIIAIHGLGNKPSYDLLSGWWLQAIHDGLGKIGQDQDTIPFEMVYWADILHPDPMNPDIQDEKNPLYLDEPYLEGKSIVEKKPTLKIKFLQYIEGQLDTLFLNDDYSINFSGLTDKILKYFFSDFEKYYSGKCINLKEQNCLARQEIRNRFYEVLKKYRRYEILLIAHSMGSVVAFDVLSLFSNKLNINTFVTIGSPLGFPIVVSRIFNEQRMKNKHTKKVCVPGCVGQHWYNLSDQEDKVALDHTLADDFVKNTKGIKAQDMFVTNDYEWNGEKNPHKSYGYLRTTEMANIVYEFLKSKSERGLIDTLLFHIKNNWIASRLFD